MKCFRNFEYSQSNLVDSRMMPPCFVSRSYLAWKHVKTPVIRVEVDYVHSGNVSEGIRTDVYNQVIMRWM